VSTGIQERLGRIDCHTQLTEAEAVEVLGIPEFFPRQTRAIQGLLAGKNVLVVAPTGSGKSAVFQGAGLQVRGITLVISPLIALMQDQVDKLRAMGVSAGFLNSSISPKQQDQIFKAFVAGHYKFLYTTPERVLRADFRGALRGLPIQFVAVDEAHVIDSWGQDFRTDYVKLAPVIREMKPKAVVALTATAGARVARVVEKALGVTFSDAVVASPDRPNLEYRVATGNPWVLTRQLLQASSGSPRSIVYTNTVAEARELRDALATAIPSLRFGLYVGPLSGNDRRLQQHRFEEHSLDVMVATNAFGLGVNYPDIRNVIHVALPVSLDSYVQEAGRCARDGQPGVCSLFLPINYIGTPKWMLAQKNPATNEIRRVYEFYRRHPDPVVRVTAADIAEELFHHAGEAPKVATIKAVLRRYDLIQCWQEKTPPPEIKILQDPRTYGIPGVGARGLETARAVFDWIAEWAPATGPDTHQVDAKRAAMHLGVHEGTVTKYLKKAEGARRIVIKKPGKTPSCVKVIRQDYWVDEVELEDKRCTDNAKLDAMVRYAKEARTSEQAHTFIRDYFRVEEIETQRGLGGGLVDLWA